ncbi:nucleotidyltransferase family protein [Bradyrhizobium sp. CB1717]|uniref:nucleotidyltransferase family protein n=1 Tax=Bradyrhizobium sp. CB1717 TaxID=3039154 RepID=UPI0024B085C7|nr:nucleotidyltransferase family protein [Bradyrhizobium sp. CB1717]WFU25165.1 nucleotidyltransferase family protein [Bradyrhizobium sp. CB1717]
MTGQLSCAVDDCFRHVDALREKGLDSLYYLAFEPDSHVQRLYDEVWRKQKAAYLQVQKEAASAGIESLVFKGAALTDRWYGRPLGCMADVDLLVHKDAVIATIKILYDLGYRPSEFHGDHGVLRLRSQAEILHHEAQHYELVPYNRLEPIELSGAEISAIQGVHRHAIRLIDGRPQVLMEVDLHHGVATDMDCDFFFDRAVTGPHGRTFSDSDHLWFGLSRLYAEVALYGKQSLRDFGYLAPLLTRGSLDWSLIANMAAEHELRPALFYFLSFLDDLAGHVVDPSVLDALSPRRGLRYRDWGWQLGKLFDTVEPPPNIWC